MKQLIPVVAILLIAAGCSTTKPVPARPMKNRIDGWDAINRNVAVGYHCPYASMDETHRRLYDEGHR